MYNEELLKEAESGDAESMYLLAEAYREGNGIEKNAVLALKWLFKSCEKGNEQAKISIKALAINSFEKGNETLYFDCLKTLSLGNDAASQFQLAALYSSGIGTEIDLNKAFEWALKAAENGYRDAMTDVAIDYWQGKVVPKNYEQAYVWFRRAAREGCPKAMCNLGVFFENGYYIDIPDKKEALEWYKKSAALGNKKAIEILDKRGIYNYSSSSSSFGKSTGGCGSVLIGILIILILVLTLF